MIRIVVAPSKLFTLMLWTAAFATFAYAVAEPSVLETVTGYVRDHVVPWAARR